MPMLPDPRHEFFACLVAAGLDPDEAALAAGLGPDRETAPAAELALPESERRWLVVNRLLEQALQLAQEDGPSRGGLAGLRPEGSC